MAVISLQVTKDQVTPKLQEKIAAKTLLTAKNDSRIGVLPPVTTLRWGLGMAAFAAAAGGEAGAGEKQRGVTMELASGAAVPV